MRDILQEALRAVSAGQTVALSTIVATSGSLPMSRRSKMLVLPDGTMRGTVGGGCLEAEVFERARAVLEGRTAASLDRFVLTGAPAGAAGRDCGGTVRIFTEPIGPGPAAEVLAACLDTIERREEGVLATSLGPVGKGTAGKALFTKDGRLAGSLGGEALDRAAGDLAAPILGTDTIRVADLAGPARVFLETVSAAPTVIVFGGGHVGACVARAAKGAGFRVIVADDRPDFSSAERHPEADDTVVVPMEQAVSRLPIDAGTFIVAVTRGHQHDEIVIRQALRCPAGYVGMIGSRRKVALMKNKLLSEGYGEEELARLHAPIGLDIGADSPGEIAVSIVAELIAVRHLGGHAASLYKSPRPRR